MVELFWNDARIERLTKLWADGVSADLIGADLGCTRNAVIGKVHRLKLKQRRTVHSRRGKPGPKPAADPRPKPRSSLYAHRPRPPRAKAPRAEIDAFVAADAVLSSGATWAALPGTMPVPFIGRRIGHQCAWMIGDAKDGLCCGQPTEDGRSFCPTHHSIAYRPVPPKERAAAKAKWEATRVRSSIKVAA